MHRAQATKPSAVILCSRMGLAADLHARLQLLEEDEMVQEAEQRDKCAWIGGIVVAVLPDVLLLAGSMFGLHYSELASLFSSHACLLPLPPHRTLVMHWVPVAPKPHAPAAFCVRM